MELLGPGSCGYRRSIDWLTRTGRCISSLGCRFSSDTLCALSGVGADNFLTWAALWLEMASELWERLRSVGLQELAPTLFDLGILSTRELQHGREILLSAGVTPSQVDRLLGCADIASNEVLAVPTVRSDLPVIPVRKRASFAASLQAAAPDQRATSVRRLHEGFMAASSTGPLSSRVRTWHEWCRAWGCTAFPLDHHNVTCCAASMKMGSYRSCAQYFSAVVKHQERELRQPVGDLVRGLIKDCKRSILRGLGPEQLKDSFDVWSMRGMLSRSTQEIAPWDASDAFAMTDVLLLSSWFMLREVELSNLRRGHMRLVGKQVSILLAVYKTDTQGSLTDRSLKCCCSFQRHLFCPYHAACRHLDRLVLFEQRPGDRGYISVSESGGHGFDKGSRGSGLSAGAWFSWRASDSRRRIGATLGPVPWPLRSCQRSSVVDCNRACFAFGDAFGPLVECRHSQVCSINPTAAAAICHEPGPTWCRDRSGGRARPGGSDAGSILR